jgi:hypothetical protein
MTSGRVARRARERRDESITGEGPYQQRRDGHPRKKKPRELLRAPGAIG